MYNDSRMHICPNIFDTETTEMGIGEKKNMEYTAQLRFVDQFYWKVNFWTISGGKRCIEVYQSHTTRIHRLMTSLGEHREQCV